MITIAAISGSLRAGSFNTALIEASKRLAPEGMTIEQVDISDLPVYNMDLEAALPESVLRLHQAVKAADGVLFACPEHNFSFSGVLKNAIDWGSRPPGQDVWKDKPVIMQSAAAGWAGGLRAQLHLAQVMLFFPMRWMRYPEVCVGSCFQGKFDDQLQLIDPIAIENVTKQLAAFKSFIETGA